MSIESVGERNITYAERNEIIGKDIKTIGQNCRLQRDGYTWRGEIVKVYRDKKTHRVYAYDFWKY